MLSFYKYGSDSEIEKLQIQGDDCYMEKGDDTCSKSAGGGRTYYYNPDKKELAKVTNDLRTHLGLPAYTKTDSDSKKTSTEKTKESKSENTSERESSNNEMKNKNSNEDTETSSNDNE